MGRAASNFVPSACYASLSSRVEVSQEMWAFGQVGVSRRVGLAREGARGSVQGRGKGGNPGTREPFRRVRSWSRTGIGEVVRFAVS